MISNISNCQNCNLYKNQRPLLDNLVEGDGEGNIMWIGLSAVKVDCVTAQTPLSIYTSTGKLLVEIEKYSSNSQFYKTNIVKCLPLNNGKIRYPSKNEMMACYSNFKIEIEMIKPNIVFMLGKQVATFILKMKGKNLFNLSQDFQYDKFEINGVSYIPIHHPSYILIFKRKQKEAYINAVSSYF